MLSPHSFTTLREFFVEVNLHPAVLAELSPKVAGINVNFCKNPHCLNFRVPAEIVKFQRKAGSALARLALPTNSRHLAPIAAMHASQRQIFYQKQLSDCGGAAAVLALFTGNALHSPQRLS
jgi:hypothetical protein